MLVKLFNVPAVVRLVSAPPAFFLPAALLYRIRVEESALAEMLGREYADCCEVAKRLIPGVY